MKPSSSPMIEKMKSVCGSGRKKSFCRPLPMPSPRSPPVPSAISDCMAWKPFPSGSASGFMNVNSRSRRYAALKTSRIAGGNDHQREGDHAHPRDAGREDHPGGDEDERRGGAEVGLEQDQSREQRDDEGERQQRRGQFVDALLFAAPGTRRGRG